MTAEQHSPRRRRFDLFGFEVFRGLLAGCTDDAFADVEAALSSGSNVRGSRERRAVPGFLGRSAALSRGCADVRLETLAAELLGGPCVYLYGDASEIHGDTYWHSDMEGTDDASRTVEGSPARLVKFVLYDTPLDGSDGALRLLPGSHRAPAAYPTVDLAPEDLPAHVLPVEPGDVIAFDPRARHAALGGAIRRQIAVAFARRPEHASAQQQLMSLVMADKTVV
ncbi:phytanoyl-CoA dioxygenase family protein [Streptomyces rubiginosohelvolus]|uniref:phytanoyl-CoA dioxygenase family protein n=1 Tax=Streptomyces rubiginosohelvolus TaxID=67362 RepID=UPI0036A931ED